MWNSRVRYTAAGLAGLTGILYFLIAAHVLPVVEPMDRGITIFGLIAGLGFGLGMLLLVFLKHRIVYILGAVLMILTIAIYLSVGSDRTPNYEAWGLSMRIPQALILIALVYLTFSHIPKRADKIPAAQMVAKD